MSEINVYQRELCHYGILGQKWGRRNGPPYPLDREDHSEAEKKSLSKSLSGKRHEEMYYRKNNSEYDNVDNNQKKKGLTDEQKRLIKIGAIATGVALAAVGGAYVVKKSGLNPLHISNIRVGHDVDLSALSNRITTISKNTKLQRISNKSVEDYASEGKSIYASYLKRDNAIYKEIMPKFIKEWDYRGEIDGGKKAYVHMIKLKRDAKIASDLDVAKAYMNANGVNHVDEGRFTIFMKNLVDRDNPVCKNFVNELKGKGFDGIIDYNDAKADFTKAPIFLFNTSEIIESSKSHKLGAIEKFINVVIS